MKKIAYVGFGAIFSPTEPPSPSRQGSSTIPERDTKLEKNQLFQVPMYFSKIKRS